MSWKRVDEGLPDDNIDVIVYCKRVVDDSYGYEVAEFQRSQGWNVAPYMNVLEWSYFNKVDNPRHD